jgi:hypothetical protein
MMNRRTFNKLAGLSGIGALAGNGNLTALTPMAKVTASTEQAISPPNVVRADEVK